MDIIMTVHIVKWLILCIIYKYTQLYIICIFL